MDEKHRSALASSPLFAVFDRDGTLVPICSDPLNAPVHADTSRLLNELALCADTKVAVLSARSCSQLTADFTAVSIIRAGNYGLEIAAPDDRSFMHPAALASRGRVAEVKSRLRQRFDSSTRIIIEDHALSLCLHYHLAAPIDRQRLLLTCDALKAEYPDLYFRQMPTSTEVLPSVPWDKAMAMERLDLIVRESDRIEDRRHEFTYFFGGDSAADEPAIRWANDRNGITVVVGADKASCALYTIESPESLLQLIEDIIAARRQS